MQYTIYSTRGVVSCLIKHSASPRSLSATRPLLSCCKSCTALRARINYNLHMWQDAVGMRNGGIKVDVCTIIITLYRHLGHSEVVNNELTTVTSFVIIGMWKLVCSASVFDHMSMHNHVLCTYAVGITLCQQHQCL